MSRQSPIARLREARRLFTHDSLFRNAVYLMASTAVMSVLGFIFWLFVAHLYSPADIGVASALIAIATLISNLSLLGLNSGLIRFLSTARNQSRDINAAMLTVAGVTVLAATAYVLLGRHLDANISLLAGSWHKLAFVALMAAVSLNSLTDAVFISNRRGEYHTIGYATFGSIKLILPLLLVPFGALGIFGAYILAMIASLAVSYYLMRRGCGYRFRTRPDWSLLKRIRGYTLHNYFGVILAGLPSQLLPLFIIKNLGAAQVAFFSMAWTMVNLLYVIPSAVTQSLLAESSFNPQQQAEHLKHTVRLLAYILVPAVTFSILVAPYLLNIFGPQYRQNGTHIFQLLALSTFFIAISAVGNTMLNIERRTAGIVGVQLVTLAVTGTAAVGLIRFGLAGVGLALLSGNVAASLVNVGLYLRHRRSYRPVRPVAFPTSDEALAALLRTYGIRSFSSELLQNGSHNCTLLIRCDGVQRVLRIYRPQSRTDAQIEQEVGYMAYLAGSGLPVPAVRVNQEGASFSHMQLEGTSWQYLLMDFADGKHPAAYSPALLSDMAQNQALMHLRGIEYAKAAGRRAAPSVAPADRFTHRFLKLFSPQGYSHFDYDASNLLAAGERVNCILDFEGMHYGPLVACIYFTLSQIYASRPDVRPLSQYVAAYQSVRKLTALEKCTISISLAARYRNPRLLRTCATVGERGTYHAETTV